MRVSPVDLVGPASGTSSLKGAAATGDADPAVDFKDAVKKAIGEVNRLQNDADQAAVGLATGDVQDVHKAMIAMQKAKLALEFTIAVRNKVIDAYQEIMRMQV